MLGNYIKIAFKVLLRHKFFTFISLFGISFTIMIVLIGVGILHHFFGIQTPELNLDRRLFILDLEFRGPDIINRGSSSYYFLNKYIKTLEAPENVSIISNLKETLTYENNARNKVNFRYTDAQFWEINQFRFLEGKPYTEREILERKPVVVINQTTSRKLFGEETAIGRTLELEWQNYEVVGIVEDVSILKIMSTADVWVPVSCCREDLEAYSLTGDFIAIILARDKADLPAIKSEVAWQLQQVEFQDKEFDSIVGGADTMLDSASRDIFDFDPDKKYFLIGMLLLVIILFMTLPALNLMNINTNRIIERHSEIGIRKSFGASWTALIRQFLVENIIITLLGGLIGLIFTQIIFIIFNQTGIVPYASFQINLPVFQYCLLISLVFSIMTGVYPAYRMSRLHPVEALLGGK